MISRKSELSALQILHRTSVVTFYPLVIFAIEQELIQGSLISSFYLNFHQLTVSIISCNLSFVALYSKFASQSNEI